MNVGGYFSLDNIYVIIVELIKGGGIFFPGESLWFGVLASKRCIDGFFFFPSGKNTEIFAKNTEIFQRKKYCCIFFEKYFCIFFFGCAENNLSKKWMDGCQKFSLEKKYPPVWINVEKKENEGATLYFREILFSVLFLFSFNILSPVIKHWYMWTL